MPRPIVKESFLILGVLLALLVVCFYDIVFLGKTFKVTTANAQALTYGPYGQEKNKPKFIPVNGTDTSVQDEPVYEFIKRNLKKKILPLWNPHQACGFPLIGELEIGMFFPLTFIMYLFPEFYSWDLLILSRLLLGGFLTYWFMRTLRLGKVPAAGAAIIFMLSGPMVLLQYWTVNVDLLTPLLLICLERLIRSPDRRSVAFLATTITLTFLAGHPEHIFLVNVYGALFFFFRFWSLKKFTHWRTYLVPTISAYALGLCGAAIVLFPFLRNLPSEFWHGHPPGVGLLNEEFRERLITLALPYFFQRESLTFDFTFAGWWGGYLGTLPLALAFLSLFNKQRQGLNYFFVILGFLILSKAYSFFYINWIGYLPIFNLCRYAIHTPHLVAFTFAVAAGMGIRTVLLGRNLSWKGLIFSVLLGGIILKHLFREQTAPYFPVALQASIVGFCLLILFQIILFIKDKKLFNRRFLCFLLLFSISHELFHYILREKSFRFRSFGEVPYIEFLKKSPERNRAYGIFWNFYPNTASGFELDDLGIFFGLIPKRFVNFVEELISDRIFDNDLRPPALRTIPIIKGQAFLDMLNVKYLVTPTTEKMRRLVPSFREDPEDGQAKVYAGEVNIYERTGAFPRAYIVHKAVFQPDTATAFIILKKVQWHLRELAVINDALSPVLKAQLDGAPVQDASTAEIAHYSANAVTVKAFMENPGLLVLGDAYHPDWKVYVDGKADKMYLTNCLIRSVFLTRGEHEVKFVFLPLSFYLGAFLSSVAAGIVIFLLMTKKNRP
ncbi:MAG: hypothetical protein A2787_02280 [Omnitrophica WOR_2 bacterium RIFCSPHIGHO2_01_FULL_48_9]|nr:MAG: hypothetical protein A3D10_02075 [Omnitrophica WOR_2 bacterium RIFCSPHIGHO2_02_FULL_48_11]OGX30095.1 MAG: hypothetical protein A2787_02280 [Omnitrophica WOR_2 bacterium RIFCSPHIGHO2_01_FULL_48_9]